MEWEHLFREIILERGYDYYLNDAVISMDEFDGGIRAIVSGTEDYEVEILIDNNRVIDMYCTCPDAIDGHNCKHMAAVLYDWQADQELMELGNYVEPAFYLDDKINDLKQIMTKATAKQINDFLFEVLKNDHYLFLKFKQIVEQNSISINKDDYEA